MIDGAGQSAHDERHHFGIRTSDGSRKVIRPALCTVVALAMAGSASAQEGTRRPIALQAALQLGIGMVEPASSTGRGSQFLAVELNAWRDILGLTGRLGATSFPQVCGVMVPVRCTYPGDLAVGAIIGLSVVSAWARRVTARATAGAGALRWSKGAVDPTVELDGGIEVMTSPPIGVRIGAAWHVVAADPVVSVLALSVGIIGRIR